MASNVDLISGGRLLLGIGAGWQQNEHEAYGIEFCTLGGRMRRLEEACQLILSLFENDQTNFQGRYYQLKDAPLAPKPSRRPPLLIGGGGEKVTMRIAAQYADEWNVWGAPDVLVQKQAVLDAHCRNLGRDPKAIKRSAQALLLISDDREAVERIRGVGRPVIAGNVAEVKQVVKGYQDAGVDELIIPGFNLGTGDRIRSTMDTFIDEVAPEFR
jgi:alkanesulfonate monooxygenase SsuD/methylene tetrahydromethanopterin reductase-like flavin-dependent oxidoreductase (luciferase family)